MSININLENINPKEITLTQFLTLHLILSNFEFINDEIQPFEIMEILQKSNEIHNFTQKYNLENNEIEFYSYINENLTIETN